MDEMDIANTRLQEIKEHRNWKSREQMRDEEQLKSQMQARIYKYKAKKEKEMTDKEKNGIYTNKLPQNTPDWIICKIGIKPDELPKPNEKGYINIDICRSKDGYYYAKLNDWKPEKKDGNITNANEIDVDDNSIPF